MAGWFQRFGEDLAVRYEAFANVELTGREIVAQHSNAELGGVRLVCEAFRGPEQRAADAVPTRMARTTSSATSA
jgi:hypothetical protein